MATTAEHIYQTVERLRVLADKAGSLGLPNGKDKFPDLDPFVKFLKSFDELK